MTLCPWGWLLPAVALQAICSSQFSVAFIPEAIRLHSRSETAQQSVCRTSTCRWAYQRATAPQGRSTSKDPSIRRQQQSCLPAVVRQLPKSLLSSSHGEGDVGEVSGAVASAMDDPFRPEKASLSPMVINALVPVLFQEEVRATEAAADILEKRKNGSDWHLTDGEERIVTNRICGVARSLTELRFMLATAVSRSPSITKYGMLADYGMTEDVEDDPLAQMNQAECLLALYIMHKEEEEEEGGEAATRQGRGPAAVDFLDVEKLEVLKG